MDSIGLYWIGRDSMKRFQWSPSDNIFTLPDVHLTSATLLHHNFWKYHFHWKVLGIEFWLFYWKTTFSFRIYRYVCQLILNVHVGGEMHIVLHQKWGHAGWPHNVSLWIGFKSFRLLNCHNLFLVGTSSQKRRKGNQELSDQQLWSWMNYREALKDGRLLLDQLP